ncbi:TRAP transporter substrate-binding protein [Falsiroseomonas tokyonensis]|uniref:TRAP transporter substrate-binding protein n=1 Tax=Falsiroseomonas tokyonensis TaxID=430521 RepID=A0ABV7BU70_9PROT|nr:TRAP transporter substrate-binding protein [Falsiroseomonas tokyonensis]MBU8537617.1 TRAP transporter substrate-binding protein [Falsiroseomonas tokyonensis]
MIFRRHILAAAGAALATPALTRGAAAQTRWQMATPYADGNFHTRNIRQMLTEIEAATSGRLSIQLHSNGALLPMPQIKRGVQTGQVQAGEILLTAYSNEDVFFDADAIPQLVTNYPQAKKLADLQKPYIETRLARQGLTLLYMVPWPPAGLYAQNPIPTIEGLRGLRFRTFSPATNRFAALVGAQPTLVQSAELAQAFATGVVQAQITSAATGVDTAAWDYAKVFTPLGFSMTKNAVLVSRRALDALSAADQAAVRTAAAAAEARGYELSAEAQRSTEATLGSRGMQIVPPTEEFLEGLRRISTTMTDEWVARAGADGAKLIADYKA